MLKMGFRRWGPWHTNWRMTKSQPRPSHSQCASYSCSYDPRQLIGLGHSSFIKVWQASLMSSECCNIAAATNFVGWYQLQLSLQFSAKQVASQMRHVSRHGPGKSQVLSHQRLTPIQWPHFYMRAFPHPRSQHNHSSSTIAFPANLTRT